MTWPGPVTWPRYPWHSTEADLRPERQPMGVVRWYSHAHPERDPCYCFHAGSVIDDGGRRRFLLAYPFGPAGQQLGQWHLYDRQLDRSLAKFPASLSEADAKAAAAQRITMGAR